MTRRHLDGEAYLSNELDYEAKTEGRGMVRVLLIAVALVCGLIGACAVTGCQSIKDYAKNALDEATGGKTEQAVNADEVDYSLLRWTMGGENKATAPLDETARISNLTFGGNNLRFDSIPNVCQSLGATDKADAGAVIVCLFLKRSDGTWTGGKFDWIADNRGNTRGLHHCTDSPGYNGWTMAGTTSPIDAAFVLVSVRTGKRSNVIKGVWTR
jgi:hypothetical protein